MVEPFPKGAPVQREYPHGRNLMFEQVEKTGQTMTAKEAHALKEARLQREYPHGQNIGHAKIEFGDDGGEVKSVDGIPYRRREALEAARQVLSARKGTSKAAQSSIHVGDLAGSNPLRPGEGPAKAPAQTFEHGKSLLHAAFQEPARAERGRQEFEHGQQMGSSKVDLSFNPERPEGEGPGGGGQEGGRPAKPQQRQYPHGRSLGYSNINIKTEGAVDAPPRPQQRQYPHGRSLGYSNINLASDADVAHPKDARGNAFVPRLSQDPPPPPPPSARLPNGRVDPAALLAQAIESKKQRMGQSSVVLGGARRASSTRQQRAPNENSGANVSTNPLLQFSEDRSPKPQQRRYPHGRSLGYSNINLTSDPAPKKEGRSSGAGSFAYSDVYSNPRMQAKKQFFGCSNLTLG